jgi:hypothetical protein
VYEIMELDNSKSNEIGQKIIKDNLYTLPTDKLIENWNFNWLDCGSVRFRFKLDSNFYSADYACLWNQKDSIKFIKQIKILYDSFIQILDLQTKYSVFESRLLKGKSYSSDGMILKYVWTKKQSDDWNKRKPQRDYQKSIKDSITHYLSFELNRLIPHLDKLNCFDDFYLTYSKKANSRN